jgi:glyoxylase-like metal-dependent hydrolase (beta-lactamase superfamily II)
MRRAVVLGLLITVGGLGALNAQPAANAPKVVDVEKVKDNLYVLRGVDGGGNTAVFITANGVTVVDAKNPGWGKPILDKIKTLTPKPVTTLINTHTHGDHVSGNVEFPATIDFVAQANTKVNMEKMPIFKEHNGVGLPRRTFKDKMTIGQGADQIDLYYFGPGHTSGDTFIVYTALRTMHAGDMFPWKDAPFIDRANGGSGVAWPTTLAALLSTVKDFDTVVTGHIPLATRQDLEEFQRYTADLLAAVRAAKKAGQSADAATAAINLSAKYKGYASERLKAAVQAIYEELP